MKLLHSMKSLWKISPILLIGAVAAFAAACGGEEKVVTEIQTVIVEKPVTQIEKVVETVVRRKGCRRQNRHGSTDRRR